MFTAPDNYLKEECYAIRGAVFEVYNTLGPGFLEEVYQIALCHELRSRNIPFRPKVPLDIYYKDILIEKRYIPDIICYDQIILELKAVDTICKEHQAQLLNYLKATGIHLGLLINFGSYPNVFIKRMIL